MIEYEIKHVENWSRRERAAKKAASMLGMSSEKRRFRHCAVIPHNGKKGDIILASMETE
ncbi:MAG: hypothetical protein V8Q79_07265 [Christensenellales bacterium]